MEIFRERELLTGKIDYNGVFKRACLEHVPEVKIGEYVLVHVGYALARLDEAEAKKVFEFLQGTEEFEEEQRQNELPG